jgi:hypothetical protein
MRRHVLAAKVAVVAQTLMSPLSANTFNLPQYHDNASQKHTNDKDAIERLSLLHLVPRLLYSFVSRTTPHPHRLAISLTRSLNSSTLYASPCPQPLTNGPKDSTKTNRNQEEKNAGVWSLHIYQYHKCT